MRLEMNGVRIYRMWSAVYTELLRAAMAIIPFVQAHPPCKRKCLRYQQAFSLLNFLY